MGKKEKFLEYLFSIGYETYEKDGSLNWIKVGKVMPNYWSNTAYRECTQRYLVKDENFSPEMVIQWGLSYGIIVNRTVTLRYPWIKGVDYNFPDDKLNKIFEKNSPEDIYSALFDKNHKLEY